MYIIIIIIIILIAAVKFKVTLIKSEMSLISVSLKFYLRNASEQIETWDPVSQRASTIFPFNWQLIEHLLPTKPTIFSCCLGVRCVEKCPASGGGMRELSNLDNSVIVVHRARWLGQCFFWQSLLQYFTALDWNLTSDLPQKLHRWDFWLLLSPLCNRAPFPGLGFSLGQLFR